MAEKNLEIDSFIEDTQHGRYLIFHLGEEIFGLEIKYVIEIIGIQSITKIPETKQYIKGIINLRGKIIPVIEMRLKFGKEEIDYTDRTCIVVIDIDSVFVGLIVDGVEEVLTIQDDEISTPPSSRTGFENNYIKGISKVNEKIQLLLECKKLLNTSELEVIEEQIN